jgi:AraC-like DNA-binding protein
MSDEIVRYWQPAPQVMTDLACAYLQVGRAGAHVHEEWQFAVPETPSRLSLGALRRLDADPDDVTVVPPYDVHSEAGGLDASANWRALYVSTSAISKAWGRGSGGWAVQPPRFQGPVLSDPAAAFELRALLRDSDEGEIDGTEFVVRALRWLEQILSRHATQVAEPRRATAVERVRVYLRDRATEPANLAELGAVAGVTVSHLVRAFSRSVGLPPKSYQTQVRLARAQRLLAQGKSLTWVAYECGFADQFAPVSPLQAVLRPHAGHVPSTIPREPHRRFASQPGRRQPEGRMTLPLSDDMAAVTGSHSPPSLELPEGFRSHLSQSGLDLENEIGRSAMSGVYRATDRCHPRPVARLVHDEAIVIPETVDCIRALTGLERSGAASIAKTDAALGVTKAFLGATARPIPPLVGTER